MQKTLNQIVKKLEDLQIKHLQLNDFYFGNPWEYGADGAISYPFMGAQLLPGSVARGVVTKRFLLFFADLVNKDEGNETEVLSDMELVALDIFAQFIEWCDENNIEVSRDAALSDFTEKWDDEVSGFQIEVTMNLFYSKDTCQVPGVSSYLLLESEDYLLLEDESQILL